MLSSKNKSVLEATIQQAIKEGTFPGIEVLFADRDHLFFHKAFGTQTAEKTSPPLVKNSLFDLASLTKPLATAIAVLKLVEEKALKLTDPISFFISEHPDKRFEEITVAMLLSHNSGLPAWAPLYEPDFDREFGWKKLLSLPLENKPGQKMVYSCLGYLLLGEMIRRITGESLTDFCSHRIFQPLGLKATGFNPKREHLGLDIIPTGYCSYRKASLKGIVHDENAGLFGGEGGNSGLFSTASEILTISRALISDFHGEGNQLLSQALVTKMFSNQNAPELEPRSFGWDIKVGSADYWSCSQLMPEGSIGHLGFTGTSLWMDPKTGLIVILLSNRVILGRESNIPLLRRLRPAIHAILLKEISQELNTI